MFSLVKVHFILVILVGCSLCFEIDEEEKTPYDYVKDSLDKLSDSPDTGLPMDPGYEVEESIDEDYPDDNYEGAESAHYATYHNGGLGQLGYGGIGYQRPAVAIGGLSGIGGLGIAQVAQPGLPHLGGLGGGLIYQPILGLGGHHLGGGFFDKHAYDAAHKKTGDENLEKVAAKAEQESKHGEEGFQHGLAAEKLDKGEATFFKGEGGHKKAAGDEKFYEGAQKVDKGGLNEHAHKIGKSHKKGHVSKGYKSSSLKNEEEKTETYYDEAHDEADLKDINANHGAFGENAASAFKGQHEEKLLDHNSQGKQAHHVAEHKIDDAKGNKGGYAQNSIKTGAEQLEKFNNLGAQSIHGHHEAAGEYQQHKPYGILPIHSFKRR